MNSWPILPEVHREELEPYWMAIHRGEIVLPYCNSCDRYQWYPQPLCPECQRQLDWNDVSPEGSVFTFTTVRWPFMEELRPALPLVLGLIELDEAPNVRLVMRLENVDGTEDVCDLRAQIRTKEIADGVSIPVAHVSPTMQE